MGELRRHKALAALALLTATTTAQARPVELISAGDVLAATDDHPGPHHTGGVLSEWVELRSSAGWESHVHVEFSNRKGKVVRDVVLGPAERRVVTLPVPTSLLPGTLQVEVRETHREGRTQVEAGEETRAVLVVGTEQQLMDFYTAANTLHTPMNRSTLPKSDGFLDAPRMPDLLAAYAGLTAVILLDPAVGDLSTAQRRALEEYVLIGGKVLFGGDASEHTAALDQWREKSTMEDLGWGSISVCRKPSDCWTDIDKLFPAPPTYGSYGWWGAPPPTPASHLEDLPKTEQGSAAGLLKDVGRPPVDAFLVIITVFALLMGPGTLLFARRFGRHTLLFSIPSVALCSCTGIAAYAVAADGVMVTHTAAQSITLLDSDAHRAVTVAVTGFFSSLDPGALHFGSSVADSFDDLPDGSIVDWSDGLTLKGRIIPPRTYRERALVQVAPSRARLSIAGHVIENHLGGLIQTGIVRVDGHSWALPRTAKGMVGTLETIVDGNESEWVHLIENRMSDRFPSQVATGRLERTLAPDEFIAVLADGDFVPPGGLTPVWHPSMHVVRGKVSP